MRFPSRACSCSRLSRHSTSSSSNYSSSSSSSTGSGYGCVYDHDYDDGKACIKIFGLAADRLRPNPLFSFCSAVHCAQQGRHNHTSNLQ